MRILFSIAFFSSFFFGINPSLKSESKSDSILLLIPKKKDSVEKTKLYIDYIYYCDDRSQKEKVNTIFVKAENHLRNSEQKNQYIRLWRCYGYYLLRIEEVDSAIQTFNIIQHADIEKNDSIEYIQLLRGLSDCYFYKSAPEKALPYLLQAIRITERHTKEKALGVEYAKLLQKCLLDLGAHQGKQNEYHEAVKTFNQALEVVRELGLIKEYSRCYSNLGAIYYYQSKTDSALIMFKLGLEAAITANMEGEIGNCLNNIGLIYLEEKKYEEAIIYLQRSYESACKYTNKQSQAESLLNLGDAYTQAGKLEDARDHLLRGIAIAASIGLLESLKFGYKGMADLNLLDQRYKEASEYKDLFILISDSIITLEKVKQLTEMKVKYESEKKDLENKKLQAESETQRALNIGISIGLVMALTLGVIIFRNYQQKKRANVVLAEKNNVIEQKSRIVEEQNKDIKDSIRYAKGLQEAILQPINKFREHFPDSFIFFKPKDIVSGDFYWFEKFGDQLFFAAADCTGHGVPGAFMSIMGNNLLNQALNEYALNRTNAILNSVNKGLAKALRTQGNEGTNVKDGMDVALCAVNLKKMELEYSGAFNPAWILRGREVIELKPDKFPVGANLYGDVKMFSEQYIPLQKGDRIYIFSDGFADQFGGPKGKKYKYKPFQKLLISYAAVSMNEQGSLLNKAHEEWKGDLEQVDDILVVGVQI